jgi:hypothetical protein
MNSNAKIGSKTRLLKATRPNGSKSARKIIGEQSFVRGGERIDDFQPSNLKAVLHVFGQQNYCSCPARYCDNDRIEILEHIPFGQIERFQQIRRTGFGAIKATQKFIGSFQS